MAREVSGDVASIFYETDKKVVRKQGENGDIDHEQVSYVINAAEAVARLSFLGFSAEQAIERVRAELERLSEDEAEEDEDDLRGPALDLSNLDSDALGKKVTEYLYCLSSFSNSAPDLEILSLGEKGALEEVLEEREVIPDIRHFLSVAVSVVPPSTSIILDVSEIVLDASEKIIEDTTKEYFGFEGKAEKILILTEGHSDTEIIKRSVALLKPHWVSRLAFLDFGPKPRGGAPALVETYKAFAAAGLSNRILAIFDNDTAARDCSRTLSGVSIASMSYAHLPDIELARSYPTVGPQGDNIVIDVNGKAVAIEMFVCSDLLRVAGSFSPVQWGGYNPSMRQYRGEIMGKQQVAEAYLDRLKQIESGNLDVGDYDWSTMSLLMDFIYRECCKIGVAT